MGQLSCGAWPVREAHNSLEKAGTLNWVLGYLSRGSTSRKVNLMDSVDQASISAWIDNYCSNNPLDDIPTAAYKLEQELLQRAHQTPRSGTNAQR